MGAICRNVRMLIGFVASVGCAGSGVRGGFESLTGNWRIEANQHVTLTGCAVRPVTVSPDGFSAVLAVLQDDINIVATGAPTPQSVWTGTPTADGFEITSESATTTCAGSKPGREIRRIIINGITDPTFEAYGVATYAFESVCDDGSNFCRITSVGPTKHISN